jgi:uroporphyrin-III C-methyltransferase/precorrin-2 dehydrogenase/sirohydrochlorin ferrochelatase
MRFLPVFLDVSVGTVALVGNGTAARSKLRLLRSAGANVRWYGGERAAAAEGRAADAGSSRVEVVAADPLQADFGELIAVVAASGEALDAQVAERARKRKIPVNVVDRPDLSTFIFPAIVDRGEVVVAIGTGGDSPVLARRLRERIEALLPARIGELAALLGRVRRPFAQARHASCSLRGFWENVVDGPIGAAVLAGRGKEAEAALSRALEGTRTAQAPSGAVFLVGAGPGDPDLLTLRALQALQGADLVFYDELVSPEILERARREAKLVFAGTRGSARAITRDQIARRSATAAREGLQVVWLKGGDGAFAIEELDSITRAGVRVIIVPGVIPERAAHMKRTGPIAA